MILFWFCLFCLGCEVENEAAASIVGPHSEVVADCVDREEVLPIGTACFS